MTDARSSQQSLCEPRSLGSRTEAQVTPTVRDTLGARRSKTRNAIVRDIRFLSDAARLVASYYDIAPEAVVEHYPPRPDPYGRAGVPGGIFAYQFFDLKGGNCAYWLPDFESVHLFETPRQWGLPKTHLTDVRRYVSVSSAPVQPPALEQAADEPAAAAYGCGGCS